MAESSSLDDVIHRLQRVLADVREAQRHTADADIHWGGAAATLLTALIGSHLCSEAEHDDVVVRQRIDESRAALDSCVVAVNALIDHYTGGGQPMPPRSVSASGAPLDTRVAAARERVGHRPVGTTPATGEWVRSDGWTVRMRSGTTDLYHDAVVNFVRQLPPEQRKAGRLAAHVEVKVAVAMREQGLTEETVVVDRSVCGTRSFDETAEWTCDKQLAATFLAPGSTLHVLVPGRGRLTYKGRTNR